MEKNGPPVKTSDVAHLLEIFQSCLLKVTAKRYFFYHDTYYITRKDSPSQTRKKKVDICMTMYLHAVLGIQPGESGREGGVERADQQQASGGVGAEEDAAGDGSGEAGDELRGRS
jgi:hypothetical protein